MKRKLPLLLTPVVGLVMFGAVVLIATFLTNREYKEPYRAPAAAVDTTPRAEGVAAEKGAAEAAAKAKPYVEVEYRAFPVVGSRVAIWSIAQLHLLFAAFVLAAVAAHDGVSYWLQRSTDERPLISAARRSSGGACHDSVRIVPVSVRSKGARLR